MVGRNIALSLLLLAAVLLNLAHLGEIPERLTQVTQRLRRELLGILRTL